MMMTPKTNDNGTCWADFWKNATLQGTNRGPMKPDFWNHMAGRYDSENTEEKRNQRLERVFNLIESTGLDLDRAQVLDIGAGTGALAIPLAQRGARVTVVDFSEGMLSKLEERAKNVDVPIERIIHASWDTVNIDVEGLRKKFDLVLASMTPAVRTPHDFCMMLEVTKGIGYYSGWIQRKWNQSYLELYRLLFNEEFREGTHGFYLPFMYLYMLGYRPTVRLNQDIWTSSEPIDEAVETVSGFFGTTQIIDEVMKNRIREYFSSQASDGMYRSQTTVTTGMMVWDMRQPIA